MEWYQDPIRARDALRAAAWQGAFRMFGVLALPLLIAAILFPAFAQRKVGPKLNAYWFAHVVQRSHGETGRWPTRFEEVSSRLTGNDHLGPHRVSFLKTVENGKEAEYVIVFDRSVGLFRIAPNVVERIPDKIATGVYP
jgi:hypothetical protein